MMIVLSLTTMTIIIIKQKKIDLHLYYIFFITPLVSQLIMTTLHSCGICLDEIQPSSQITTQCSHIFHATCLSHWLLEKNTCPLCRHHMYELDSENEELEDEEDEDHEIFIDLSNNIISQEDSVITKMTERIADLCSLLESDFELPLKYAWQMDSEGSFFTIINTKKYRCSLTYTVTEFDGDYQISVSIDSICKQYQKNQRILDYGYQKWRTKPRFNNYINTSMISCS